MESWTSTFLSAKPRYMASIVGTFLGQSPAQMLAGMCEITLAGFGVESCSMDCRDDTEVKTWNLSPAIPGPMRARLTSDWCII